MVQRSSCPLCSKRRSERFCPAVGEKICAVCCGTERERSLDCPAGCVYLITAHRYEQEHRPPPGPGDIPYPDVELSRDLIYEQQPLINGLVHALVKFSQEQRFLTDPEALAAITALAETHRTLVSGIYYEKPLEAALPAALYATLAGFLQDYKNERSARAGFAGLKDSEAFTVLVYLARACRGSMNGRPRSRLFLNLLRAGDPQAQERPAETSRIITL
jgi:hypothetical protein